MEAVYGGAVLGGCIVYYAAYTNSLIGVILA